MPLTNAHRCQICGDVLFHSNFFSDPSQHFCLSENGPGMMTNPHVKSREPVKTSKGLCESTPNTACQEVPRGAADSEYHLSDSESEASLASA